MKSVCPSWLTWMVPQDGPALNVAVHVRSDETVTDTAAFVPEQAPLQPEKLEPGPAVAVSVTIVPEMKAALHVPPQSIPAGLEETLPLPPPLFCTVKVWGCGCAAAVVTVAWAGWDEPASLTAPAAARNLRGLRRFSGAVPWDATRLPQ